MRCSATAQPAGVGRKTITNYNSYIEEAGKLLGFPAPRSVTLEQMKKLESQLYATTDRTLSQKCSIVRAFLRHCGNREAMRWKYSVRLSPYRGGVFLREQQVARIREEARNLGVLTELVFSLAVDMGLRCVDMKRLTLKNAQDFLDFGESEILGKGRDGGKRALQIFNDMVEAPLRKWLAIRSKLGGESSTQLLVREVHYRKRHYLAPRKEEHMEDMMKELSERTKVHFRAHDLRRTLGNRLWRRGVDLETIAKILRHEGSTITLKAYIGTDSNDMRDAMRKLCPSPLDQQQKSAERYLSTDLFSKE